MQTVDCEACGDKASQPDLDEQIVKLARHERTLTRMLRGKAISQREYQTLIRHAMSELGLVGLEDDLDPSPDILEFLRALVQGVRTQALKSGNQIVWRRGGQHLAFHMATTLPVLKENGWLSLSRKQVLSAIKKARYVSEGLVVSYQTFVTFSSRWDRRRTIVLDWKYAQEFVGVEGGKTSPDSEIRESLSCR